MLSLPFFPIQLWREINHLRLRLDPLRPLQGIERIHCLKGAAGERFVNFAGGVKMQKSTISPGESPLRTLPCSLDLTIGPSIGVFTDHLEYWWLAIVVVVRHRVASAGR